MYSIKEMFYSLQGEGAHTGRPAIFLRFSGCNLWSGLEKHRREAICQFCDTDFIGTDGQNGGKFKDATTLADTVSRLWPSNQQNRYVICTGGEPALQLDTELILAFKDLGFEVGIETNGTLPLPKGIDWICVSPKGRSTVVVKQCHELKLVYPQPDAMPDRFTDIDAGVRYLSPKNPYDSDHLIISEQSSTRACIEYCLAHPQWRLCLQTHKILKID
ncbi:7-carboxy-7-deazaguanine synthase [Gynuella sunshinyii]|uniref:7-carboxy-7-deazaguanine synthase n=1 Tax=Gynuella sunshinyii YC6258 TaxID=1445510 RepID=A0A0C5V9Z9_9GAMM|nr:7-carboxy-7-deazaguanine synthase [Gynuella sunshinyii]AJQ96180.1 organic radical activating enzyme [Gynuella sunshinyii YC6258]